MSGPKRGRRRPPTPRLNTRFPSDEYSRARAALVQYLLKAALAIIRELCPQVAVLDCNIPVGDVPKLLTSIKAACPQTRCLVLADGPEQQREAESAGADVTVLKGFPAARLAQTLAKLLKGK